MARRRDRLRPSTRRRHRRCVRPLVRHDRGVARRRRSPLAAGVRTDRRTIRRPVRRHLTAGHPGATPPDHARPFRDAGAAAGDGARPVLAHPAGPGPVGRGRRTRLLASRPAAHQRRRSHPHRCGPRPRLGGGRGRHTTHRRRARHRHRRPRRCHRDRRDRHVPRRPATARPAAARRVTVSSARHPR